DLDLVASVARTMPEATFAFVGPAQMDVSATAGIPNVHWLGKRAHDDVPRYIKGFDVGIVPYLLTDYTANVYPTKLNEYLAMGIPVVATDLPEIRRFNDEHGGVIAVAGDADAFAGELRRALHDSAPSEIERRVTVAHSNSWQRRIAAM